MTVSEASIRLAVRNVAAHSDTDVLPFSIENHWFHDAEDEVVALVRDIDANFNERLKNYPIVSERLLTAVGYTGFRPVTQIDPVWNVYLLALVIELAPEIEAKRLPPAKQVTFSYRYLPDPSRSTLFDHSLGWGAFQRCALDLSKKAHTIVSTDISDFYSRIYHHRLENALMNATANHAAVKRIMVLLRSLSQNTSYGLPVGGDAARILAELVLNRTDKLLVASGLHFCRFVDDYYIFAESRGDAQIAIVTLSEVLFKNEGLTLSRAKTRFLSPAELARTSPVAEPEDAESSEEATTREFIRLRLNFDPYSPTANEDYEELQKELRRFDVVGMLSREMRKSRINEPLARRLVSAIKHLEPSVRDGAALSIANNIEILYPIFPTVCRLLRDIVTQLDASAQIQIFDVIRKLLDSSSHVTMVPTNMVFAIRLLAHDPAEEAETTLIRLYGQGGQNPLARRDSILAMTRRRGEYWLSHVLRSYSTATPWERRSLLAASYVLGDEGNHWRDNIKRQEDPVEGAFRRWLGSKNSGQPWEIPI